MILASKKIFVKKIDKDYINKKIKEEYNLAHACRHPHIGKLAYVNKKNIDIKLLKIYWMNFISTSTKFK